MRLLLVHIKDLSMIERFTLPNGLRVIAEPLPHLRSVSIGVWVRAGSIL